MTISIESLEKVVKDLQKEVSLLKQERVELGKRPPHWYYSVEEFAMFFRVHPSTVTNCIRKGLIQNVVKYPMPRSHCGFAYRIPEKEVLRFADYWFKQNTFALERLTSNRILQYNTKTRKIEDIGPASPETIERRQRALVAIERKKRQKEQERTSEIMKASRLEGFDPDWVEPDSLEGVTEIEIEPYNP